MNVGVFGGTFDPPHIGHVIAAQDACAALGLHQVLFVPAAVPPHKRNAALSPAPVRLEMLTAALADDPRFEISTIELDRPGPSYTVDTLRILALQRPRAILHLLIGVDQAREFASWHDPHAIVRLADVVMLTREGGEHAGPADGFVRQTVMVTRIDVSSTMIRSRVAAGEPIRYLVSDAVRGIIERRGLYL